MVHAAGGTTAEAVSARDGHRVWWLGFWPTGTSVHWWLTFRTIDPVGSRGPIAEPIKGVIDGAALAQPLAVLARALVGSADDDPPGSTDDRVARSWSAALASPRDEARLAVSLGRLLLPEALRSILAADVGRAGAPRHTVVIAAGPSLAQVPFELLAVDDAASVRLIEVARVRGGLHAAATIGARDPAPPAAGGILRVIDPGPSSAAYARRGGVYGGEWPTPIYPARHGGVDERWFERVGGGSDRLLNPVEDARPVTREVLSEALRARPGRLLYLGHAVSGDVDAPARAGLVLADPADGGPFRPFTAAEWIADPALWPAPPLVAVMSCQSNDTHLLEQMGLVQAAVHAGGALITSTRWVLPADRHPDTATTDLALAVDRAHDESDPICALRRWQLGRLSAWRRDPGPETAPLIWAAPVSYQSRPLTMAPP